MKSASEWSDEFAVVQYNDPAVHGQMLPHPQTVAFFKKIQLDAWKQGMTDAANIAVSADCKSVASHIDLERDEKEVIHI